MKLMNPTWELKPQNICGKRFILIAVVLMRQHPPGYNTWMLS